MPDITQQGVTDIRYADATQQPFIDISLVSTRIDDPKLSAKYSVHEFSDHDDDALFGTHIREAVHVLKDIFK